MKLKKKNKNDNMAWIIKITVLAFFISLCFSLVCEITLPNVSVILGLILIFLFIALGILFDMIGVAITSVDEKPFHSMSSRKVKGSKMAVKLIKNAPKVSSFCNDVIGDICGIVSGSAGVIIASKLADLLVIDDFLVTFIITALVAALTIGGKAIGKTTAIKQNQFIVFSFAKFLSFFTFK